MNINWNELLNDSTASFLRVLIGGSLASIIGIIVGLLRYQLPKFLKNNIIFNFCIDIFKFPPPLAYIPFVILLIGIGQKAAIAIVFIGVFPAVMTSTYESLEHIRSELLETARSLEIKGIDLLTSIYLPAILPQVFTGIRIGFSMGWMSIIASEMISGDKGLGYALQVHRLNLNLEAMILNMIAIGLIGYLINFSFKKIEMRLVQWKN
jgi:ABC-type nitrate/sulfonate/bicarbonate transport system permease component